MEEKISKRKIKAYVLNNAINYNGSIKLGSVINSLFAEGLEKTEIKEIIPKVNEIIKEVSLLSLDSQKKELESLKELISHRETRKEDELPELKGVKNGVIMRFSPSSSASAFHIGHVLTGMLTSLYVKKYGGKFFLRIEDTNPEKTVPECYESFPKEAEWIFGNVTEFYAQSDKMKEYYDFAEKLIKRGHSFVCTCKKQEDNIREKRKICSCRDSSVKENLDKWKKMLDKNGFREGEAVLRFKSKNLNLSNPALVDFPLARINLHTHPRQKNKYKVWPLMNLCVTYDDITQKCTHIIRAKEHRDNAKRQEMIFDALNIKKPFTYFLGRYKFTDLEISKTKIAERIANKEFEGWDDIRLPLVRIFKKRGYQPRAFEKIVIKRGISEVDKVITKKDFFKQLDDFNREILKNMNLKKIKISDNKTKENSKPYYILLPDNVMIRVYLPLKISIKDQEIIYFINKGYCKFHKDQDLFWFTHP